MVSGGVIYGRYILLGGVSWGQRVDGEVVLFEIVRRCVN